MGAPSSSSTVRPSIASVATQFGGTVTLCWRTIVVKLVMDHEEVIRPYSDRNVARACVTPASPQHDKHASIVSFARETVVLFREFQARLGESTLFVSSIPGKRNGPSVFYLVVFQTGLGIQSSDSRPHRPAA